MRNPIDDFELDTSQLAYIGHDLARPECILAERDGTLWAADARGGVMKITPDGSQTLITQQTSDHFDSSESNATRYLEGTLPNGLAFDTNGDFIIANFGTDRLERMDRSGGTSVMADSIDGMPIGKVNFALRDSKGRIWITVSTRVTNWMHALRTDLDDGYIAMYDGHDLRVVADGFHFTNEIRFDRDEEFMYVVETTGGCVSRLRVGKDGSLTGREVYGPAKLGKGAWPDGVAFDAFGNLWGTCVYSDKLFVIKPNGDVRYLLDEGDPDRISALEEEFVKGAVTEETLFATGRGVAPWMASVTFGGADLRTAYIGSLKGSRIPSFRAPVAGLPMVHW